jgi:hypothetical protein
MWCVWGKGLNEHEVLVGKSDHLEDLDVDEWIILKWILSRSVGRARYWTDVAQDRDK